jgi:glycosyltransferase involved in cell wall biosynthesis
VPHPFGNTAAKWFYVLIKELLTKGHGVVCLTASEEPAALVQEARDKLSEGNVNGRLEFSFFPMRTDANVFRRKWRNLLYPYSELAYVGGFVEALRTELAKGYDILHLEQLWTGWVGGNVPNALLNVHHFEVIDWEGKKFNDWKERKAFIQMQRATSRIIKNVQNIRLFTNRLRETAESINPKATYWVIPFALDLSLYPLQPMVPEPIVGLIGSMHWEPSRSAGERLLTRLWPLVKKKAPSAKLLIAGWNAQKYLGKFLPLPDVTLRENLAHPTEFFSQVALMAYTPSRGSGMKIKVMEAMAYGVPVVTTWEGMEGLDYEDGVHGYVAEADEVLAARIVSLLADRNKREAMRMAARQLMEARYSPGIVVQEIIRVYEEIKSR